MPSGWQHLEEWQVLGYNDVVFRGATQTHFVQWVSPPYKADSGLHRDGRL